MTVGCHRYFTHRTSKAKRGLWIVLAKGIWHAYTDWLFEQASTNAERFALDLSADRDMRVVDRLFSLWIAVSRSGCPGGLGTEWRDPQGSGAVGS